MPVGFLDEPLVLIIPRDPAHLEHQLHAKHSQVSPEQSKED
jgi:hypothetical protein